MGRRTSINDARKIEEAGDLEDLVKDERAGWRASASKATRRQRRYKRRLIKELLHSPNRETPEDEG
ncbi:MAG: hypothetical protein AAFP81_10645 [Pseudomonadota bacterium]